MKEYLERARNICNFLDVIRTTPDYYRNSCDTISRMENKLIEERNYFLLKSLRSESTLEVVTFLKIYQIRDFNVTKEDVKSEELYKTIEKIVKENEKSIISSNDGDFSSLLL